MLNIFEYESEWNFLQFWLYLLSNTLSIICCFVVLCYIFYHRTIRTAIHNHSIIVLLFLCLIYELIDIPLLLFDIYWIMPFTWYRFWSFIDIGLYNTLLILFAQSVIERHIILFHEEWLSTSKRRLFLHYLPIVLVILYCLIWYSYTLLFSPPGESSIFEQPSTKLFEMICHQFLPFHIIIIFSIALLMRGQPEQHKLIFQIISISILYLIFYFPSLFVGICLQLNSLQDLGLILMPYSYFLSYYLIFLLPLICWLTLPEK